MPEPDRSVLTKLTMLLADDIHDVPVEKIAKKLRKLDLTAIEVVAVKVRGD